jgi:hypothetical protein
MIESADHHPRAPLRLTIELEVVEPIEDRIEGELRLQSRQVRAQARVDARPELQVLARILPVDHDSIHVVTPSGGIAFVRS